MWVVVASPIRNWNDQCSRISERIQKVRFGEVGGEEEIGSLSSTFEAEECFYLLFLPPPPPSPPAPPLPPPSSLIFLIVKERETEGNYFPSVVTTTH